jgi:hypothetical protein
MSDATSDKLVNYLMDRTDKFGAYIAELAKQLGVAAEHVYGVMIRQQYTEAVGLFVENGLWLLIWLTLIPILVWGWKKTIRVARETRDDDYYIGVTVCTIIFAIVFIPCIVDIVGDIKLATMKMINPEYYALKDIMEFIQAKVKK